MKNFSKITVRNLTNSNSDYSGSYLKTDVEAEMRDLGYIPVGNDWIEWVIEHVFMFDDVLDCVQSFFNDVVVEMKIDTDQGLVQIKKS